MTAPRLPRGFSHPVKIGCGGFGTVYRARQDALKRWVAIKFIDEKNLTNRNALLDEAAMQARLHIQGIPQVYDVNEFSGRICIIMQWVHGCDLRSLMQRPLLDAEKWALIGSLIRVVATLHSYGYAHRDLKPENIIISPDDGMYLVDFGLARHAMSDKRPTISGIIKGTPEYMAPEIWKRTAGPVEWMCADVYSMGVVIRDVLGEASSPHFMSDCLQENPEHRPKSATNVLAKWNAEHRTGPVSWKAIAGQCSDRQLAEQLHGAAQELVNAQRASEAYGLLLECIALDPEFPPALQMMDTFPVIRKKINTRRRVLTASGVVTAIFIIIAAASLALVKKHGPNAGVHSHSNSGRSLFLSIPSGKQKIANSSLPFKETSTLAKHLGGEIQIAVYPGLSGVLLIDDKEATLNPDSSYHVSGTGDHVCIWRNAEGTVEWREIVSLLPFQKKRLFIQER
jgi:serine/threonine protein kinase